MNPIVESEYSISTVQAGATISLHLTVFKKSPYPFQALFEAKENGKVMYVKPCFGSETKRPTPYPNQWFRAGDVAEAERNSPIAKGMTDPHATKTTIADGV